MVHSSCKQMGATIGNLITFLSRLFALYFKCKVSGCSQIQLMNCNLKLSPLVVKRPLPSTENKEKKKESSQWKTHFIKLALALMIPKAHQFNQQTEIIISNFF